ncbi:MAG TPA: response regulator transcription factor [Gemmatimonadaceae bacterium]|nr:response regulator transcription factor [Gemmatimonadaceae bacterium]
MTITVVIADDHPVVLMGLDSLFALESDLSVLARARDGEEALEAVLEHKPDVLLVDFRMPKLDGLGVLDALRHAGSHTRTVLLSASLEDVDVRAALRRGARGVVLKEHAPQELVRCIRTVYAGGWWLEHTGLTDIRGKLSPPGPRRALADLTDRESEIVTHVRDGLRNKEIASKLGIAEGTVKIHLNNIYRKLGVDSRVGLVLHARSED